MNIKNIIKLSLVSLISTTLIGCSSTSNINNNTNYSANSKNKYTEKKPYNNLNKLSDITTNEDDLKLKEADKENNLYVLTREKKQKKILAIGLSLMNVKYDWGGKTIFGLDCSGLVTNVYKSINYEITGAAKHMAKKGKTIPKAHTFNKKLEIGDLLFFKTTKESYSHVGIYIGNSKFLHASSLKGKVITSSVHNNYYKTRLELVKRII